MVIVNLFGGLGNQMFQYAFGEILSLNSHHAVKYNIDTINRYNTSRAFELEHAFDLNVRRADRDDLETVLGVLFSSAPARRLLRKKPFSFIKRNNHLIDGDVFDYASVNSCSNLYFDGYWQSASFFTGYEQYIYKIFEFNGGLSVADKDLIARINISPSIAAHVRRGDYVSSRAANRRHGVLSTDYYIHAISAIRNSIPDARVFFFSDDHGWVADALLPKISNSEIVFHNTGVNSFRDMQLMSVCENHVIANSTFSWWGAWLSKNPSKLVVAPKNWFNSNFNAQILPDSWVTI